MVARQFLQHQAGGLPFVGHQQQPRGELLGLAEVILERAGERIGLQRDQALVAHGFATVERGVLDGDGQQRAFAEIAQVARNGTGVLVDLRDAAQRAGRGAFGEQRAQRAVAAQLYRQAAAFASFGFNKSHAAAFARTAYESAFLKLYYPAQLLAGLINAQPMGFYPIEVLVNDARRHGVPVLPVDINRSRWRTTTEWVGMPHEPLPEGELRDEDLAELRFDVTARGYRMSQVDGVVDRLRRELREKDEHIAFLESGSAVTSDQTEADEDEPAASDDEAERAQPHDSPQA